MKDATEAQVICPNVIIIWLAFVISIEPTTQLDYPCVGNYTQIFVQVAWQSAIVSCESPAKDHGPEPRRLWFLIRCNKQ